MSFLQVDNLTVTIDDFTLDEINFSIEKGNILALLGPSGSGKTSLIQAISGLIPISRGRIVVAGKDITDLPVHKRKIGIVFQEFALFPHLTVYENIAFGLKNQKLPNKVIRDKVAFLLDLVGMKGYEKRNTTALSGGEKQRVALARTLAPQPDIILFDEPLSAVDEELRTRLREQLAAIHQEVGFTAVYVTHDREEAFFFADLIGIIFKGRIWQIDKPEQVYDKPVTPFIAGFLGIENRLSAKVVEKFNGGYLVKCSEQNIYIKTKAILRANDQLEILIKPENAFLSNQPAGQNSFPVKLLSSKSFGSKSEYLVSFAGRKIKSFNLQNTPQIANQQNLFLNLKPETLLVYKDNDPVS